MTLCTCGPRAPPPAAPAPPAAGCPIARVAATKPPPPTPHSPPPPAAGPMHGKAHATAAPSLEGTRRIHPPVPLRPAPPPPAASARSAGAGLHPPQLLGPQLGLRSRPPTQPARRPHRLPLLPPLLVECSPAAALDPWAHSPFLRHEWAGRGPRPRSRRGPARGRPPSRPPPLAAWTAALPAPCRQHPPWDPHPGHPPFPLECLEQQLPRPCPRLCHGMRGWAPGPAVAVAALAVVMHPPAEKLQPQDHQPDAWG